MKGLIIAVAVIAIAGLGGYLLLQNQTPADSMDKNENIMMENDNMQPNDNMSDDKKDDTKQMADDKMEGDDEMMMDEDKSASQTAGQYTNYDEALLARADSGDVVLFFHAQWCPYCRGLDSALHSSRSDIPSDLTILKVDYDTASELKKKYAVTYQHTLVQVDAAGNMIAKWNGSPDLADIVKNLK